MEAEIRHLRDRDEVDLQVVGEDREDLVAVDRRPVRVDCEHAVAVAVEGDSEVEVALEKRAPEQREVGRAAAEVDVVAVGVGGDGRHGRAELFEGLRRDRRVGAVRAIDRDAETRQVAAEPFDDVLEVGIGRDADVVDLPATGPPGCVEQPLDLLLGGVAQLAAVAIEELEPVVFGGVVRGRDHDAEVEREQGNRRSREHAAQHRVAAGLDDSPGKGLLELGPRAARVAADENSAALRPERRSLAEALDELVRQVLPYYAADAVRSEVPPSHGGGG